MKKMLFVSLLFIVTPMTAEDFYFPAGTESAGLNHASVGSLNFWSAVNNPSASAFLKKTQVGLAYESRFNMDELSIKSLAIVMPREVGSFTTSFQYYGYEVYNEMKLALGYARKFGDSFSASMQFDVLSARLSPLESMRYVLTADASLYASLTDQLSIGFLIFNFTSAKFNDEGYEMRIPTYYRLGISWLSLFGLEISAEINGQSEQEPSLSSGLRYELVNGFNIFTGLRNKPLSVCAGVGFERWNIQAGLSCNVVQTIGKIWTCSLSYPF